MKKEQEFRKLYLSRGVSPESVSHAVDAVKGLLTFAGPLSGTLDTELVKEYVASLVARGENEADTLRALMRYAYVADYTDTYTYLASVLGAHGVIASIAERTAELAGGDAHNRAFDPVNSPPLGAPQDAYLPVVKEVVANLHRELGPGLARRVLAGNHHRIPESSFEPLRQEYLVAGLDALLAFRREKLLSELEQHARSGKPWYEQFITPEVVEYVREHPEIQSGVRHGRTLVVAKIPYDPVSYLNTHDPVLKRYYQCHCPLARASIIDGGAVVSSEFCYCSAGFAKLPLEVALGQPVTAVEVLETALGGDTTCRFALTLPEDVRL